MRAFPGFPANRGAAGRALPAIRSGSPNSAAKPFLADFGRPAPPIPIAFRQRPLAAATIHATLETNISNQNRDRRRSKLLGFIIAETVAVGVLLLAGVFVLSARPVNSMIITTLNVVMLAASGSAAVIPILFFAFTPILPRGPR
jgi:hypothetical protein